MVRILCIVFTLYSFTAFAEVKEFLKESVVPVPSNQSQEQVIQYTTKTMTREATEEAGVFISSLSEVKNGVLKADDIISVAGSISEIIINRQNPIVVSNKLFVDVSVTVRVDVDAVEAYLKKIIENDEYKKEASALRQKNLELENQLKKANKEEFDTKLSKEVELLAREQQKRYQEIEEMAAKARAEFIEAEKRRKNEELKAVEQLLDIKKQFAEEDAESQRLITQERDLIAKAELENAARIEELKRNVRENRIIWDTVSDITAEAAVEESTRIRAEITYLKKEFKKRSDDNENKLKKVYEEERVIITNRKFLEQPPQKIDWMKSDQYEQLLQEYNSRKNDFRESREQALIELKKKEEQALSNSRVDNARVAEESIAPLISRLEEHQNGRYPSIKGEYASISFGMKDVDNDTLPFALVFENKIYEYDYVFESTSDFRSMYETRSGFYAVPTYGVEAYRSGAKAYLSGFMMVHMGNGKGLWFKARTGLSFEEVKESKIKAQEEMTKIAETSKASFNSDSGGLSYDSYRAPRYGLLGASMTLPLSDTETNVFSWDLYYKYNWQVTSRIELFVSGGVLGTYQNADGESRSGGHGKLRISEDKNIASFGGSLTAGASFFFTQKLFLSAEAGGLVRFYSAEDQEGDKSNVTHGAGLFKAGIGAHFAKPSGRPSVRAEFFIQTTFGDEGKDLKYPTAIGFSLSI